jgi:hypothetical protein
MSGLVRRSYRLRISSDYAFLYLGLTMLCPLVYLHHSNFQLNTIIGVF